MTHCYVVTYQGSLVVTGTNLRSIRDYLQRFCECNSEYVGFKVLDETTTNQNLLGTMIFRDIEKSKKLRFDLYKVDFAIHSIDDLRDDSLEDLLD
jgi:hypothetical protein